MNKVGDQYGEFYGDTACATLSAANGVQYLHQREPGCSDIYAKTRAVP